MKWKKKDEKFLLLILLLIVVLIAVFVYYPAVNTFISSFTSRDLRLPGAKFVFLKNYTQLLASKEFWQVVRRSLLVVVLVLPLEMVLGLGIALLLNKRFLGRGLLRTVVILPLLLPPVVNGFLWGWLLNGDYGAFNGLLYQLGIISEYKFWLKDPSAQIFWVAVVQIWTRVALPTLILLAGLQSIPEELYEAAKIDGASAWQCMRCVILPLLTPAFTIALTLEFIAAFQIFDVAWALTAGGTVGGVINPFTKTLMIYNYQIVFRDLKIGLGSALAYIILFMSLTVGIFFVRNLYDRAMRVQK